jgi:chromosome segregation ATPase
MARIGITQEEVFQAAEAIRGEGETPSIDRVRVRLGNTGSPNTIHKYLKIWKASLPPVRQEVEELEPELLAAIAASIAKKAAAARAKAEKETIEANAQLDSLAENSGLVDSEIESVREQNEALEVAQTAAAAEANALKQQIEKLDAQCKADQGAAESARTEVATARVKIETQAEQITDIKQQAEKQADELKQRISAGAEKLDTARAGQQEAERVAAVAASEVKAETRRADQAEKREAATAAGLQNQIDELKKEVANTREEAKAARLATAGEADKWVETVALEHKRNAELTDQITSITAQNKELMAMIETPKTTKKGVTK